MANPALQPFLASIERSPVVAELCRRLTDARHAEIKTEDLFYEGGLEAFVRYLDRAKTPLLSKPVMVRGEPFRSTVSCRGVPGDA